MGISSEVQKNLRDAGPHPLGMWGVADPKKHATPPHVTIPNFVTVGQTVWAYVGSPKDFGIPKIGGHWSPQKFRTLGPLGMGRG